jgi:hypothetical protein
VAALPGKTGMCATWQIEQVASEPGASVCQKAAPIATEKMAASAAMNAAR